jgi:radical SAM superfamily enzyme YgiQ (UPF0313 family)
MKVLFVYPRFRRHAECHPELLDVVPMNEYLGSPSLGIACLAAMTPPDWEVELRDDRVVPADRPTDADLVAISFFTPAATRAFELARWFRAAGKPVVAGGIFPTMMPEATAPHVDAVVIGEGEGSWRRILDDAREGRLAPRYGCDERIDPATLPPPRIELYLEAEHDRFRPDDYPVQISRGCPLSCHACVLPTSMTRALRLFPLDHVIDQLDRLGGAGKLACLTEDTSWLPGRARNHLAALFERLVERGGRASISYVGTSMPMLLLAPPALLASAKRAGIDMFYLVGGFDPITMKAFTGRDPQALARAEEAIARAHDAGIEPYTSFLLGLDDDDEGTVDRILEFAVRTGLRKAEFAVFTPYPGTPSWHRLLAEGRILHHRWHEYNDANVVFRPARMSPEKLQGEYLRIWRDFYAGRAASLASLPREQRTIQF